MWDAGRFRELMSGRRRGATAALSRGLLRAAEMPYAATIAARNRLYDLGWWRSTRVSVPVVSIGNLTAGGTGKTPLAAWLVDWAQAAGIRVVLVSRGYGARVGQANDEALELADRFPTLVHLQQPDRVAAAREAIERHAAELILLDDGFQHRRLARDLDIVLLDALEPFGFEHLLPRGLLRESLAGLRRAQVIGLSRADLVGLDERARIQAVAARWAPEAQWVELAHQPTVLRSSTGAERPWRELVGRPVVAFAGIGNPAGFRRGLQVLGFDVVAWREFRDHHAYSADDCRDLARWATASAPHAVGAICTHKDLVKIRAASLGELPLEALVVQARFLTGEAEFAARLITAANRGRS